MSRGAWPSRGERRGHGRAGVVPSAVLQPIPSPGQPDSFGRRRDPPLLHLQQADDARRSSIILCRSKLDVHIAARPTPLSFPPPPHPNALATPYAPQLAARPLRGIGLASTHRRPRIDTASARSILGLNPPLTHLSAAPRRIICHATRPANAAPRAPRPRVTAEDMSYVEVEVDGGRVD